MTEGLSSPRATEAISPWQRFWFTADPDAGALRVVRVGLSVAAAWYFASHWSDVGLWLGSDGALATDQLAQFIAAGDVADAAQWRWSPLYMTGSVFVLRLYLLVGVMLAVLAGWVQSSRVPSVMLWLWCVWLANRSLLISGPEELALVFGLAYLAIASPRDERHWTTAFARRLIQVHTTLLIGITGLTMLSANIWWDGTGSFAVAAPKGRRLIDFTDLLTAPWFHEPVTHAIVLTAILAPVAIWLRPTRWPACVTLLVWLVVLGLLSSQWLYVVSIAVLLQSFRKKGKRPSAPLPQPFSARVLGDNGA